MADWPWPEDTHEDRLRRIIDFYRRALLESDVTLCTVVDKRMTTWGQSWVCSTAVIDRSKLVTAQEVAREFDIRPHNVHDWSRRHPDLVPKRGRRGNQTLYLLSDILAYQSIQGARR
ncbi:MerR family transcriptional regulator [Mycolicibacterium sp. S2-37]|uniref:MerR family transcriptional regulator n=1 Tax=Mycolicibacterium sp. S2-37 TaxID=2810297 RepID=UPI001A95087E|nr:MerR family transcriptional regulator [Mycolicibacterium sp. S2-37]MBO0676857.1 MerR family transcriptional regulator [Mycolicibacterium sp. S2-37]